MILDSKSIIIIIIIVVVSGIIRFCLFNSIRFLKTHSSSKAKNFNSRFCSRKKTFHSIMMLAVAVSVFWLSFSIFFLSNKKPNQHTDTHCVNVFFRFVFGHKFEINKHLCVCAQNISKHHPHRLTELKLFVWFEFPKKKKILKNSH